MGDVDQSLAPTDLERSMVAEQARSGCQEKTKRIGRPLA